VPQRERRPRPIMDYTYNEVNTHSLDVAPQAAMQFGHTWNRFLQQLAYANPRFGPPLIAKLDLADGYYRVPLSASAALELAVVLPSDGSPEPLIGIPLSLPMGWLHSPPYFCSFTETVADLANAIHAPQPTHPFHYVLEAQADPRTLPTTFADTATWPHQQRLPQAPLTFVDVYLDDFIAVAQQPQHIPTLNNVLHHLNTVFRDVPASSRRPVVSTSKVDKGDATFSHIKVVLGWQVDTHRMVVTLPPHRADKLSSRLTTVLQKKYSSKRQWQQLLGELRSIALALHSAKYLFSILQHQLVTATSRRFRIKTLTRQTLHEWARLIHNIRDHPIPIRTLVPHAPHYWAATDASLQGMGGFWLPATTAPDTQPWLWRFPFPKTWQTRVVSQHNPMGDITNSDLELAAFIAGHATRHDHTLPLPHATTYIATDNSPTQAWVHRGSTSTDKCPAFLLHLLAHVCRNTLSSVRAVFTPGTSNTLADLLSRSFSMSDTELLTYVQKLFPVQPPWQLATPPNTVIYNLNYALSRKLPPQVSPVAALGLPQPAGTYGKNSVTTWPLTHSSQPSVTQSPCSKYSLHDTGWEPWLPPGLKSKLARWKMPYEPLARPWPHWGTLTQDCNLLGGSISDYSVNSNNIQNKIHPL
jgi:hypothetical protein